MHKNQRTHPTRMLPRASTGATLTVLAALATLVACHSTRPVDVATTPESARIVRADPPPTSELALLMREMTRFTDSTGKRLMAGQDLLPYPGSFKDLRTAQATPGMMDSTTFQPYAMAWLHHLNALYESPAPERPAIFNTLVNTCSACHTTMCPGPLSRIKKLSLPETDE